MDLALLFSTYAAALGVRKITQQRMLYEALRDAIVSGALPADTRLPATRALARELGIARNSALFAYEQLSEQGFLTVSRRGSVVARSGLRPAQPTTTQPAPVLSRRSAGLRRELPPRSGSLSLSPGSPALDKFPLAQWRAAMTRAWRALDASHLDYGQSAGTPELRGAIADYLRVSRGVQCHVDQVFITNGTQASLDVCARILADAGDNAWIEDPGYSGVRAAFQGAELSVIPIAVDGDGMAATDKNWAATPPKLIYVTPSHQYPLGGVLSVSRRHALLDAAYAKGTWIIEDDYDCEFRHAGSPQVAMQGMRAHAPVIYIGTFSKTMFPSLRIAFMVVPEGLAHQFALTLGDISRHGRVADQLALTEFIRSGAYTLHLRRMKTLYTQRRVALQSALARHLGDVLTVSGGAGGMHLTARLDVPLRDVDVCEQARVAGLAVFALSTYCLDPLTCERHNGFVLGYSGVPADKADAAMRQLADIIAAMLAR